MKTIVFCSYDPLTPSVLRLFPLDFLNDAGFAVQYWDLSALFGHTAPGREVSRNFLRRFTSWRELESALGAPEAAEHFITVAVPYEPRFFRLHFLLSRSRATLAFLITGVLPMPPASSREWLRENIRLLLNPDKVAHFLLKRAAFAARRAGVVRGYDFVFAAGDAAREEAGAIPVAPVNFADYDEWMETKESDSSLVDGRYAVYLDQFAPAHPDFKQLGVKTLIDPARYYSLLNDFFTRLEKKHDLKIVIAAHPKSDYPKNPFDGRKILHSSTRALVRRCEFALATISTALGFAVLGGKPLIFFTTEDMMDRYRSLRHDVAPFHFARALGRPCVVLDRASDGDADIPAVDARLYDDYICRYLASPETQGRPSREIYRGFFAARGYAPGPRS